MGAAVTLDTHPSLLNSVYGGNMPVGFQVFLRLRPSRVKAMAGGGMSGMSMPMPPRTIAVSPAFPRCFKGIPTMEETVPSLVRTGKAKGIVQQRGGKGGPRAKRRVRCNPSQQALAGRWHG